MSLLRLFIVLSLALLAMQGARAHTHDVDAVRAVALCASAQQPVSARDGQAASCRHRCPCCATDCGVHCGALIETYRFCPQRRADGVARPSAAPRYAGIMRAPPVRPPISLV
ncbi:hypothetical protein LMG29542_00252 [Paraburkholderia humisilvae]|uniref:Uncharacterized protein n=2 Tax=Paraburkholderia humisilvae TaxID=627669 RepID=A0A6J5CX74_9BURK|nr:hypothetical protein LMG29542_00252 [Paraburkholderia humisilvae]